MFLRGLVRAFLSEIENFRFEKNTPFITHLPIQMNELCSVGELGQISFESFGAELSLAIQMLIFYI
ncbi:MAG: hypothetical protein EA353_00565 [Puniceicoccaceae bacterium]|nr:MAG: hypothetical protein EA353_00565 [Puniceicoccaceae bacterium]